jgi:hypothetical protein
MCFGVACGAERDEVLLGIVTRVAAKFFVVNFQVRHRPTQLASPAIATQHLLPQALV